MNEESKGEIERSGKDWFALVKKSIHFFHLNFNCFSVLLPTTIHIVFLLSFVN